MNNSISIRSRIIRLVMIVSALIIGVTSLLFATLSTSIVQTVQRTSLLSSLGFSAEYCVPSLLFDDPAGAVQVLNNFKAMPQVEQAVLLDKKGAVFASYNPRGTAITTAPSSSFSHIEHLQNQLHLSVPVNSENEKIGELHVIVSTKELTVMIQKMAVGILIMIPGLLGLAYLFGSRLQNRITNPILALSKVVEQVKYGSIQPTIAEQPEASLEITILTNRFREMLSRIEAGENELLRASEFLHTIVDSMPSLLIVVDQDNRITLVNKSSLQYCTTITPVGMIVEEAFPFLEKFNSNISKVLISGEKEILRTVPVAAKEMLQCDIELFPLNTNQRSGVVIIITDITELAQKDHQLIQIQKMEMVGTLAGGLAHDFNNILSGIVGTLSLMDYQDNEPVDIKELQEYVEVMNYAGLRAREMIDHLLSLSYKSDTTYGNIDLKTVISHVIRLCEHSIDKKVRILSSITEHDAHVKGNAAQLEQVLLNLCVNAAHSMTIMRSPSEPQGGNLIIRLVRDRNELFLSVEDSGIGMDETVINQIFTPFFTTKEKGKGTGLGLSMVYNIINQHGGSIKVDSTVGKGTTFTIQFHVESHTESLTSLSEPVTRTAIGEGKSILLIDDDNQIRQVAGKMLQRLGFTTYLAEDGLKGIEQFQELHNTLDLVLLDMVMPGLSGKEVYEQLRIINPTIPVILSSGFGQDDRVVETLNSGIADFVHKPYTFKELQEKLGKVLHSTLSSKIQ